MPLIGKLLNVFLNVAKYHCKERAKIIGHRTAPLLLKMVDLTGKLVQINADEMWRHVDDGAEVARGFYHVSVLCQHLYRNMQHCILGMHRVWEKQLQMIAMLSQELAGVVQRAATYVIAKA